MDLRSVSQLRARAEKCYRWSQTAVGQAAKLRRLYLTETWLVTVESSEKEAMFDKAFATVTDIEMIHRQHARP